jgi:uncharacterized protein YndB with AHSA1/START domain
MLLNSQANADTEIVIDRQEYSITLMRSLAASREQVFEAWTQPEQVARWWDPTGEPLAACEIDLQPGGTFRFVNSDACAHHEFMGIYEEIISPDRLVFKAMGTVGRVHFEADGVGTRLTVKVECGSAANLDQYLKMGIHIGTGRTLDNLIAYLVGKYPVGVQSIGRSI